MAQRLHSILLCCRQFVFRQHSQKCFWDVSAKNLLFLDSQEILLLFTSHVPQLTQQDFFMNTIVLGNEYVQQRIVVQNKEIEIIIYYESTYYNRSRLFPESTRIKGRVTNLKEKTRR